MARGAVSLDTVMIKIESEAGKSTAGIDRLSKSLANLKSAIAGGFNNINKLSTALVNLGKSATSLDKTAASLENLSNITDNLRELSSIESPKGLNATVKRLRELSTESEKLGATANNLEHISDIVPGLSSLSEIKAPSGLTSVVRNLDNLSKIKGVDSIVNELQKVPEIVKPLSSLGDIANPKGFEAAVKNLGKLPEIINKFDTTTFENLKRVSEELAQSLTPLADKMQKISEGYSAFSKIQNTFGKSASTATRYSQQQTSILRTLIGWAAKGVKNFAKLGASILSAFGKSAHQSLKRFRSQFKQIFLSLLGTRTIFTMTRKAISEYQAFDQTLQKFSTNVWRAFGAQLAPVVEYVMDLFKQFVRVIYSFVLAITGIDLIARANERAMASWGKSAKDTLGNLQKFDDLNVVEFPETKGDDNQLIQMDKIDLSPIQKIVDWVKKMKTEIAAALDTGEWYNVGVVFADGINAGIGFLIHNMGAIREAIYSVGYDFVDALNGAIEKTNWRNIGVFVTQSLTTIPRVLTQLLRDINWEAIGIGLADFIEGFDFGAYIKARADTWIAFVDGLKIALAKINWAEVGRTISDGLVEAFKGLNTVLGKIDFKAMGENLRTVLSKINWNEVLSGLGTAIYEVFSGVGEFLQGLFDLDIDVETLGGVAAALLVLVGGIQLLSKISSGGGIGKSLKSMGDGVKSLLTSLGQAAMAIAILGGLALVLTSLADVLTSFGETGMSATEGVTLIISIFAGLALAMLALQAAFNAMDWKSMAAGLVMLAGLSAVFATLSSLLDSITATGFTANETMAVLAVVMGSVIALIAAMTIAAMALQNPMAMAGVAVVVAAIAAVMFTLKETLPTILDACGKFINVIAPSIIELVTVIGVLIQDIIYALGTVLPPIINSVGNVFKTIFNGVAKVINEVGNTIVRILNAAGGLVDSVLTSMLNFINELGPAINRFVDNAIIAVTKLINFIVSSVEYLINTAIINPINKLIKTINNNAIADALGWQINTLTKVKIDRFAPQLATGTNEIPNEGLYHLHQGEAVVPKKYNPALGNGGSDEMVAKMDMLIDIMNNMNFTNIVNVGNKKLYEGQQAFNKTQQNKYGTINLY